MNSYEEEMKVLAENQKNLKRQELEAAKSASLNAVNREETAMIPKFAEQKKATNVQSQVQAKNFAEYLANRGQTNAGIAGTAELSRQNVLGRDLGTIQASENTALTGFANSRNDINTGYNNDLIANYGNIDQALNTNILSYRDRLRQEEEAKKEQLRREALAQQLADMEWQRQIAERQRQEEVDRQNALTAYQRSIALKRLENTNGNGNGLPTPVPIPKKEAPKVRNIGNNTIAIQKPNGEYATLTITQGANDNAILKWGQQYGVDLSEYLSQG